MWTRVDRYGQEWTEVDMLLLLFFIYICICIYIG